MDEEDCPVVRGDRRKLTRADLSRVNLGEAFWKASTDGIQKEIHRKLVYGYRKKIFEMVESGSGLIFSGSMGVGKTSAAACILKEAVSAGFSCYFVSHSEMKELRFEKMPSLFGNGTDGITVKRKIETADVLVLDGFNEQFFEDNAYGPAQLEELLVKRTSGKLVTIMTSRCASTMLKEPRFASLFDLVSLCMVSVEMAGENLRNQKRAQLNAAITGLIK